LTLRANLIFSRRGRLGTAFTIVAVLGLWLAPAALAHHSILSGVSSCEPDGGQKITWTATNSEAATGNGATNRTQEITAISVSSGTLGSTIVVGTKLAPQSLATSSRDVVSTGYSGTSTAVVTLTVSSRWLNPNGTLTSPLVTDTSSSKVTLKGGCKSPPDPKASIEQNCADGAVVTLKNDGDTATTFTVYKTAQGAGETVVDASVAVAAHSTVVKKYAMAEDETSSFRATSGTFDSGKKSLTNDCTNPHATVVQECSAGESGGATIAFSNVNGKKAVTFEVFKNGSGTKLDTVPISAGGTASRSYPMSEDETATFRVKTADGYDSQNVSLTNNCTNPGANVVPSCADGGALVTLTNAAAKKPVTFKVFKNGVQVDGDVVVQPGATATRSVAIAEDATATIKVTGTNFTTFEKSITRDCTDPGALIAHDCAQGGAVFNLTNKGVLPTTFQIFKNGTKVGDDIVVAAKGSTKKVLAMVEDEKSTFQVKTTDGFVSDAVELVHNCTNPGASVTQSCQAGGAVFTLTNTGGALPISFDVFKNGTKVESVAVAANATVSRTYAMAEDETASFRATSGVFDSGEKVLVHDCTQPGAAIVQSCTAGGAFFALVNRGQSPEVFTVARNGAVVENINVAAASAVTKIYAMGEDETSTFRASTADGFDSGVVTLTHDCVPPAQVLGVQIPRSLPATGAGSFPLGLRAVALLGLGVVILRMRVLLFGRG
jgi:hypothetical protein